jgi:hypothetical protein
MLVAVAAAATWSLLTDTTEVQVDQEWEVVVEVQGLKRLPMRQATASQTQEAAAAVRAEI